MEMRKKHRTAFTLIELLVTLSIIGILLALLLPAVQQAREAARRTACRNHLRQMGLAMHNYHDAHQAFPPGWIPFHSLANYPADRAGSWAWGVFLLPYLDQGPLYHDLGVSQVQDPPPPGDAMDLLLPVFNCPSDASGEESGFGLWYFGTSPMPIPDQLVVGYKKSNYIGVHGITLFDELGGIPKPRGPQQKGMFEEASRTRMGSISDGASNTLAAGERLGRKASALCPDGAIWIRNCGQIRDPSSTAPIGVCGSLQPMGSGFSDDKSVVGVTYVPINISYDPTNFIGFSSRHAGGAMFLLADGSVRFVNQSIDQQTYMDLATIAGGEVIGEY